MRLRDVVVDRPRVLFVGINPGLRSGLEGRHFAGPGNPFWRLLHASGLTPELLTAQDNQRLAEFGYALTNLCPRSTRQASELSREEKERGLRVLKRKVRAWKPEVVALVGVTLYKDVGGRSAKGGPGPKPERLEGAHVYVLPNPSGINASFPGFEDKLVWFRGLREWLEAPTNPPPPE